jgi:hypothetical protein
VEPGGDGVSGVPADDAPVRAPHLLHARSRRLRQRRHNQGRTAAAGRRRGFRRVVRAPGCAAPVSTRRTATTTTTIASISCVLHLSPSLFMWMGPDSFFLQIKTQCILLHACCYKFCGQLLFSAIYTSNLNVSPCDFGHAGGGIRSCLRFLGASYGSSTIPLRSLFNLNSTHQFCHPACYLDVFINASFLSYGTTREKKNLDIQKKLHIR